jgi:multidrug resistance efflux pump
MKFDLQTRRNVGAGAWAVGLVVALLWGALDGSGAEGVGYGFAPPVTVAALETGRLLDISVALHDAVTKDQIVVRIDPEPILEEREIASAALLAVQQEQARLLSTDARRFAEGVESTMVNQARLSAQLFEDQALLSTLQEKLSLEQDLASTGASSVQAVEEWRRQIRVVEARLEANRRAVAAASNAASGARQRSEDAPVQDDIQNDWQVVAATRVLEQVEGRLRRLDLPAQVDGQVVWLYHTEGDVVPAGEPILQIRKMGTREVVAFVDPSEAVGLEAGEQAHIRRATGQHITGTLVSVGSGPQQLPIHLWRMPSWPEYGVPVRVALDQEIAPDESVTVRL